MTLFAEPKDSQRLARAGEYKVTVWVHAPRTTEDPHRH